MKIINKKEIHALMMLPLLSFAGLFLGLLVYFFIQGSWMDSLDNLFINLTTGMLYGLPAIFFTYGVFTICGLPAYLLLKKYNRLSFLIYLSLCKLPSVISSVIAYLTCRYYDLMFDDFLLIISLTFVTSEINSTVFWLNVHGLKLHPSPTCK